MQTIHFFPTKKAAQAVIGSLSDTSKMPGKALNTYLRKDIAKQSKENGYHAKTDRLFPAESYAKPVEVIDTKTPDGFDSRYAENAQYSAYQVAQYAAKYCELNHLKVA